MDFRTKPVSINEFIHDDAYMGRIGKELHPLWKRDLNHVFGIDSDVMEWLLCLAGDTKIPLLDGGEYTLEELHKRWEEEPEPFWVYSISPTGEVVPGKVTRVTKFRPDQLYKIKLDDGTTVRANADHEFVCRDGVKRRLKDLKVGDRMMPFTTKKKAMRGQKYSAYEIVYLPGPQKYAFTHRCVGKALAGGEMPVVWEGDRAVLHHIDMDCLNNDPSNLEWMGWSAHRELHCIQKSPEAIERLRIRQSAVAKDPNSPLRKGHKKFMNSRKGKKVAIENLKKGQVNLTRGDYVERGKKGSDSRWKDPAQHVAAAERCAKRNKGNQWGASTAKTDVSVEDLFDTYEGSLSKLYSTLRISRKRAVRLLRDAGLEIADLKKSYENHRIVSIELDGMEPVYCLTVPEWENFAISTSENRTGIFSGNTGAIGVGKTTLAMMALTYCTYRLSCLHNPASYYALLPDSTLAIGIFSVTKRTVADTGYSKLRNFYDSSPYFHTHFRRNQKIDSVIDFCTTGTNLKVLAGCVAEGTLISTPAGLIPIEDLESTLDSVSTITFDGRIIPSVYSGVVNSGKKVCVEVCTDNGKKLVCSETHKVLAEQADGKVSWVEASSLEVGATVYSVPTGAEVDGVLSTVERETRETVQALPEKESQQTLPHDKDLYGQSSTSDRPAEAVQQVQEGLGAGLFSNTSAEDGGWDDETVFELIMQAMRVRTHAELLQREHGDDTYKNEGEAFFDRMEVKGSEALGALLRGEQRIYSGSYVVSRRPCKTECKFTTVAQRESHEGQGAEGPICVEASREVKGEVSKVSTDSERESRPREGALTSASQGEDFTGYIYGVGLPVDGGVLWVKVLLLWQTTDSEDFNIGPSDSNLEGCNGRDTSEQHCSVLRAVQFKQEQSRLDGVDSESFDSLSQACGRSRGNTVHSRVHPVKVVSVKTVGLRQTYDVREVPHTHAIISDGIISKNSRDLHAIGLDVFAYAMDEANFMAVKKDKESGVMAGQAYDIYNAVYSRVLSRFMRPGGVIPGLMLLMSSKKAQSSFLEEHMKKVKGKLSKSGKETTYISDYPLWAVKEKHRFGEKIFRVEVGDRMSQSRILESDETPRDGSQVVEVPDALLKPFTEDVDQALRDLAGVATFNVSPLIRDRLSVEDAVADIPKPFSASTIIAGTEDDDFIEDYINIENICRVVEGRHQPRLSPKAPRVVHLDLALRGDAAGFAMGHISGLVKIEKPRADGIMSQRTEPFIVIDQMFRIEPPLSGEIELAKIRAYITFLSKFYNIIKVTADGFQSADTIQILNKQSRSRKKKADNPARNPSGANQYASLYSVDRNDDAYLSMRAALFDRRIAYYRYPTFIREALDLQRDILTGKVDHPDKGSDGQAGSKDVTDAVAGVVAGLLKDDRAAVGAQYFPVGAKITEKEPNPKKMDLTSERDSRVIAGRTLSWSSLRSNIEE